MKKTSKDERTIFISYKINSWGLLGVLSITGVYLFDQIILKKSGYSEYSFALNLFIGLLTYLILAPIFAGIMPKEVNPIKTSLLISSIVSFYVGFSTTLKAVSAYGSFYFPDNYFAFFASIMIAMLSAFVLSFILISSILYINNVRQNKLEKEME